MPPSRSSIAVWLGIIILTATACNTSASVTLQPAGTAPSAQPSAPTVPTEPAASPRHVTDATPTASAQATLRPSPNLSSAEPPEEIRILHGFRYSCGAPFAASALWGPANAEDGADPAAEALRAFVQDTRDPDSRWLPDTGWIGVARTDEVANYVSAGGALGYVEVSLDGFADGSWKVHGYGDCEPEVVLHDRVIAPWKLDRDQPPTPASRELHVRAVLQIGCPFGPPPEIVIEPHVRYGANSVDIILGTPTSTRGTWDAESASHSRSHSTSRWDRGACSTPPRCR